MTQPYLTPEQVLEVAQLTTQGNRFYADARSEGTPHEIAYHDAVFSYGKRSSVTSR